MKPENKEDKFAVAAIGGNYSIVGHLMEGKTGKCAKTIFYSLRVVHIITVTFLLLVNILVTSKTINQGNGEGMKMPCIPAFTGRSNL